MKKVLAVLAVVLLFSGAAFASPAELTGLGGMPVQFTNLEENAVLNPALLGNYASKAVIGVTYPTLSMIEADALVILSAGPGILAIGAGPRSIGSMELLATGSPTYSVPTSTFNLGYAMDLKGMKAGLSVAYGVDNTVEKPVWDSGTELENKDVYTDNTMALKVALGVAMDAGMPIDAALSISIPGYVSNDKFFSDPDNELASEQTTSYGAMDIALDAKTTISGMILALNVAYNTLQYQNINWQDTDLDGDAEVDLTTTNSDSSLDVNLLAGKVIKATENLTVTIGSGVKVATYGAYKSTTENKVADTKTINNADVSGGMTITVPFNLAVNVDLGKLLTISNDKLAMSVGISKEAMVLDNSSDKSIDTTSEDTEDQTDYSDLNNTKVVTGAVGLKWQLSDATVNVAAGADISDVFGLTPVLAASCSFAWK